MAAAGRRVRVTEQVHEDALAMLRAAGIILVDQNDTAPVDAIIVRTQVLGALPPRLSLISKHGVGVDNISLEACRAAGVAVMNTPGANSGAVAEHSLMLMLALARDLAGLEHAARKHAPSPRVAGLEGRRLLVVGYGASGQRLAGLGAAMGMAVTVLSRSLSGAQTEAGYAVAHDLRAALGQADVVSLHCPLTPATRHMIDAEGLAAMPAGALVINCARGGLIDEAALIEALASGRLGGAGLDVTETEPLPAGHPLLSAPRLILTPHAAAMSAGAFARMGREAAQNVIDFFEGHPRPAYTVVPGGRQPG